MPCFLEELDSQKGRTHFQVCDGLDGQPANRVSFDPFTFLIHVNLLEDRLDVFHADFLKDFSLMNT